MRAKRRVAAAVLVATLANGQPSLARDPLEMDRASRPEPAAPPGLYLVTDVYAGDTVVTSGATTTYGTSTVRDTPGTYARVLAQVGTGVSSAYDGRAMNARRLLPDGRRVAGTYYEDFVLTARGYVSVNIVFFQDDALTAAAAARPSPSVAGRPAPPAAPASTPRPLPPATPTPRPLPPPAPRATEAAVSVTAGVALDANGPTLARIEVLRGRPVRLWPRVFVGGRAAVTRSWRLLPRSGATTLTDTGGMNGCDAAWLALPAPGASYVAVFEVASDELPGRLLRASIEVAVRSPALVQ